MGLNIVIYIGITLLGTVTAFFTRWYTNGSRIFWHSVLDFFGELERMVSLRITASNWYRPLYGDYTRLGMVLGIPIRIARIALSLVLYLFLLSFFAVLYILYLAVPVFLLSRLV